jgi:hypothetical protein
MVPVDDNLLVRLASVGSDGPADLIVCYGGESVLIRKIASFALLCAFACCTGCQNQAPQSSTSGDSIPPAANTKYPQLYAEVRGDSSLVYVKSSGEGSPHRLTNRTRGWETHPVLAADGDTVAYALADGPEAKSEVWASRLDGSHAHRVSGADEDAIIPAFGTDNRTLFYIKSRFLGHHSNISRPGRHEFDVVKAIVDPDGPVSGSAPLELTQQHYYDLLSLSVAPDDKHFLVSAFEYPVGWMIEEFEVENPLRIRKMFQPHVPSEPKLGATFGQAAYIHDGMDIVFTAATQLQGDTYDYNVYQMSDVTGGELVQLTHRSGMIDEMTSNRDGTIVFSASGKRYTLGLAPVTR